MTIRSTSGRIAAFAWLAFAALNIADLAFGFTGDPEYTLTTFTIAALLLLGCGIAYTVGLRPAIIGDDAGVTVRNPLRDMRAPWRAVRSIEGKDALTVRFTGPDDEELRTRAWVHQMSPRAQAKAEARARKENTKLGAQIKGRTPAAFAAEQLNEMRDRQRPKTRSAAPAKAAPGKAAPGKATPAKAAPGKAAPGKAAPAKTDPGKAAPGKAAPGKAAPAKAAPAKVGKGKAASGEAGKGKAGQAKTDPGKAAQTTAGQTTGEAAETVRGKVSWSLPALAALAVPALAVVACAVLAAVN